MSRVLCMMKCCQVVRHFARSLRLKNLLLSRIRFYSVQSSLRRSLSSLNGCRNAKVFTRCCVQYQKLSNSNARQCCLHCVQGSIHALWPRSQATELVMRVTGVAVMGRIPQREKDKAWGSSRKEKQLKPRE